MPSPNVATQGVSEKAQDKIEFGSKLAKKRSQEFSAKVARWNSSGGGLAPEQKAEPVVAITGAEPTTPLLDVASGKIANVVKSEDNKENEDSEKIASDKKVVKSAPQSPEKTQAARKASREVDIGRQAWVRRKSKTQVEQPVKIDVPLDVKHAGTPKKRVISDGHWRRDRLAKPEEVEKEKEREEPVARPSPRAAIVRGIVASVGLKVPPIVQTYTQEVEAKSRQRRQRARSPSRLRSRSRSNEHLSPRQETPDFESSGTKVYIKRRQAPRNESVPASHDFKSSGSSLTTSSIERRKPSGQTSPPVTASSMTLLPPSSPAVTRYLDTLLSSADQPGVIEDDVSPPERRSRRRRSSRRISRSAEQPEPSTHDRSYDPPNDSAISPLGAPHVYGSRIEGWLAHTSDPFREVAIERDRSSDRRRISHRQKSHSTEVVEDDRPRRYAQNKNEGGTRELTPDASPIASTLKRRGARRTATSPIKDRSSREASLILDRPSTSSHQRRVPRLADLSPSRPRSAGYELDHVSSDLIVPHMQHNSELQSFLEGSALTVASDGDGHRSVAPLQRRLTKHSDLISVLSVERQGSKNGRTRRSTRSRRHKQDLTVADVMNNITTDELKYQRELRTLVDGVIPVLLNYVLSTNATKAPTKSLENADLGTQAITKPIVELGVALERLKSVHKRIPMHDYAELIAWADSAKTIYADYLMAWRLGFQDIVVNLAPADEKDKRAAPRWDQDLPRNDRGELVSGDGERVDVAYLLKRPLVRLKHLGKALESIEKFDSSAKLTTAAYDELVNLARKRSNEEKARLEDEAAAAIDPTRARECRTLAPIAGVQIDSTRCVRARDFFDLDLRHSNGQQLNCKVELILRDDAPDRGEAGDVLCCEVSPTGKWLLFPPIHSTMISARQGRNDEELIIMLRGYSTDGREWREVLALIADHHESVSEWLMMLPASPVPRNLATKSSFDLQKNPVMSGALPDPASSGDNRLSTVREMDIPIGEQTVEASRTWDASEVNSDIGDRPHSNLRGSRRRSQVATIYEDDPSRKNDHINARDKRVSGRRPLEHLNSRSSREKSAPQSEMQVGDRNELEVWRPSRHGSRELNEDEGTEIVSRRPGMHRRTSSVPSMELPTIAKVRDVSHANSPQERGGDCGALTPSRTRNDQEDPSSAPAKLQRRRDRPLEVDDASPVKQKNDRASGIGLKSLPSFTPAFLQKHRRSSSPLKHEYEPSSASSDSDSEVSAAEHEESFTSEEQIQDETLEEQVSTLGELKSFPTTGGYKPMKHVAPPESIWAPSDPSLAPSESASQAPYRTVPQAEAKAAETVASIFAWADSGVWESLHPEECYIIVTPGLIEAFDSAQAHAAPAENEEDALRSPSARGVRPLVALELTPLVPLRRGTALDISIRSPPSANSLYRTGNNIMFRSRNTEECERLYHMLNRARIDNPTYIALQRARGPQPQSNWGEMMQRHITDRPSSGWWNLRSKKGSTYRSKSLSRPQSVAATESSIGTMNTAFSALRRFSGSNRFFNIAKSTITSRQGTRSTYSDSLDSGVATPAVVDPSLGTPLGVTNMKIRLYIRETASKWRDMGAARLTILIPPRPDPSVPANPLNTGREKRIIISGKTNNETLLDATLGEACFERIARTGIAINVWKENIDGMVANTGGVLAAKTSVYMIQTKSDREAAYTFGLVGKLRY